MLQKKKNEQIANGRHIVIDGENGGKKNEKKLNRDKLLTVPRRVDIICSAAAMPQNSPTTMQYCAARHLPLNFEAG